MWKSAKSPDPLESGTNSQPSLTSANLVLKNQYAKSVIDDLSETLGSVTQDFGSVPILRKRVLVPHSINSTSPNSQDFLCQNSVNKVLDTSTKSNISTSTQSKLRANKIHTEVKISSPSCSSPTVYCYRDTSKNDEDHFSCPATTSSPLSSIVLRDDSIDSADSESHRFVSLADHCTNDNKVDTLHQLENISQSSAKISQLAISNYSKSPLNTAFNYTPSYLGVSVAAFGYTRYGSTSKSVNNLTNTKNSCITNKHRFGNNSDLPISLSHDGSVSSTIRNYESILTDKKGSISLTQSEREKCESPSTLGISTSSCRRTESGHGDVLDFSMENVKLRRKRTTSHNANSDDQQHWNRSSLIMLAVAHASPRGRVVTPTATVMNKPFVFSVSDATTTYETVCESQNEQNTISHCQTDTVDKSLTHILHEDLSIIDDHSEELNNSNTPQKILNQSNIEIDGNYYLKQVDQTEKELLNKVSEVENDLRNDQGMDDEVSGLLRTASGKAKLLISEKFSQFRGLCHQNLSWENSKDNVDNSVNESNTTLVTLLSDLDGFWAMVSLQVDDVRNLFKQVDCLRANQWKLTNDSLSIRKDLSDDSTTPLGKQKINRKVIKSDVKKRNDLVARQHARERLELVKRNMRLKNINTSHEKSTLNMDETKLIFV
ncbi:unnamed protein product [Heterobilharzia americana]|nr:unnamed protein product [Heterobilharzia americana]